MVNKIWTAATWQHRDYPRSTALFSAVAWVTGNIFLPFSVIGRASILAPSGVIGRVGISAESMGGLESLDADPELLNIG
jgi:hypothetical protein